MRFTTDELRRIAHGFHQLDLLLRQRLDAAPSLPEDVRDQLRQRGETLAGYAQGLAPAHDVSLVDMEFEEKAQIPRRCEECLATVLADLEKVRLPGMLLMLTQGAAALGAALAEGSASALEEILERLGFLAFRQ